MYTNKVINCCSLPGTILTNPSVLGKLGHLVTPFFGVIDGNVLNLDQDSGYMFVKTHSTVHLKLLRFIVCKLTSL